MKKTKKKVLVLNKIQFAPIFDMDGNLFQTNNRLAPSLETTFKILRSEVSWTGDLIASNGLEKWKKSILIIDIYIGERSSKVQRPT